MKRKIAFRLITVFIVGISFAACQKEDENTTEEITRDKYVGTWAANETPVAKQTWESIITIDAASSNKIKVSKFANLAGNALVIVSGMNLTIPAQSINGNEIEGTGKYQNSNLITWSYSVNDGADIKYYTAIYNRK